METSSTKIKHSVKYFRLCPLLFKSALTTYVVSFMTYYFSH